jgi:hypothetical protein
MQMIENDASPGVLGPKRKIQHFPDHSVVAAANKRKSGSLALKFSTKKPKPMEE